MNEHSDMMRGVFLDRATVDRDDLDFTNLEACLPDWDFYPQTAAADLLPRLQGAQIVVTNKVRLDAATLAQAPELRLICVAATGTNNVDLKAARQRDVVVCNVQKYATASVVQHAFTLLLNLYTHVPQYHAAVQAGRWQQSTEFCLFDYHIREIAGKILGIVGYGELGRAVARVAEAFGMRVLLARRPGGESQPGRLPLAELLPQVDVLSLHCPLTAQTQGLIDAAALALLPPHAVLINCARGGIVDEQALAAALRAGRLGGAAVDVLAEEPPCHGSPLLEGGIPNLLITPHIAWASRESRQRLLDELVLNIRQFLVGSPRNRVD